MPCRRRGQRFIRSMSAETGEKGDGSLSDGALGGGGSDTPGGGGSGNGGLGASGGGALTPSSGASGKARIGLSFMGAPGMGKKSSSTSQLSATGKICVHPVYVVKDLGISFPVQRRETYQQGICIS